MLHTLYYSDLLVACPTGKFGFELQDKLDQKMKVVTILVAPEIVKNTASNVTN
jgi:hypothetical protein